MLDTMEDVSQWEIRGADAANLVQETSTVNQGSACIEFDKTGTSGTTATIRRKLRVPVDMEWFHHKGASIALDHQHANYTNFASIAVRLVYRYDTSGNPAVYETLSVASGSWSGGAWNTNEVALSAATGTGSPTATHRRFCVGYEVEVTMGAAANTFADLFVDALRVTGVRHACLIFDSERLPIPPLDDFRRGVELRMTSNETQVSIENQETMLRQTVAFGLDQVRHTHEEDSRIYGLEESLRLFHDYAKPNTGWGLAWPANEMIDTTLASNASAKALSISVTSATDFAFGTFPQDIRIGPNSSRRSERVRALSRSGTTIYIDRPLAYAHGSGTAVRSVNYYPSLGAKSLEVTETGDSVRFSCSAVETE